MQPRREAHSGGHTGFVPTRFGTRGRGFKSRRLDQDPEMAFLPSRGLGCCEGFEPQPPKRLEMRHIILGCRFTRPPRARDARLRKHPAAVTHEGAARAAEAKLSSLS